MKMYFRFTKLGNKKFDVCCTHYNICLLSDTVSIWNGVLDGVHCIRLDNIIDIEAINPAEAGIEYICYNDISLCISEEGLGEVI